MVKVCLAGLGRTGQEIAKVLLEQKNIKLVGVFCSPQSDKAGKDLAEYIGGKPTNIIITSTENLEQKVFKMRPDVVIDFTTPSSALRNAITLSKMRVNMVIGTTGFSKMALNKLYVLTRKYKSGIVYAPNITMGVNVLMLLTNLASRLLNSYDFQITEVHHKNKKDSPSGTAIKIAKEIKKGIGVSDKENEDISIPINSVRAGGVVGRHEVMIVGQDDKIEIAHESFSRKAFALGTIEAVNFIFKKSGYYEMKDVLKLDKVLSEYTKGQNKNTKESKSIAL